MKTLHDLFNYLHEHVEAFFKHDPVTNTYTVHQSMSHPTPVARVTPGVIQDMQRDNLLERYATGYKIRQQRVREVYTPRRDDSSSLGSAALGAGFGIAAGLALSSLFDNDDHSSSIGHHDDDSFTGGGGGFSGGGSDERSTPSYDPPSHSDSGSSSSSDWGSSSDSGSSDSGSSDSGSSSSD